MLRVEIIQEEKDIIFNEVEEVITDGHHNLLLVKREGEEIVPDREYKQIKISEYRDQ